MTIQATVDGVDIQWRDSKRYLWMWARSFR